MKSSHGAARSSSSIASTSASAPSSIEVFDTANAPSRNSPASTIFVGCDFANAATRCREVRRIELARARSSMPANAPCMNGTVAASAAALTLLGEQRAVELEVAATSTASASDLRCAERDLLLVRGDRADVADREARARVRAGREIGDRGAPEVALDREAVEHQQMDERLALRVEVAILVDRGAGRAPRGAARAAAAAC